jgi:small subunit ribosomal protein S11
VSKKKDKKLKKENKYSKVKDKAALAKTKKKVKLQVLKGIVYVNSSYNNTMISITDYNGNALSWSSPGVVGFSGSRKSTAYAATKAAEDAVEKANKYSLKEAIVIVKGVGMGRQAAVKGLRTAGLKITSISDHTPIPHGGVRPKKHPRGS